MAKDICLKEKDRVRLIKNEYYGWNEETGTIIKILNNGKFIIMLDEEYLNIWDLDLDFGIREIHPNFICFLEKI